MPYHVGKKGSNGCSGFPVVDDKGKVMGCHPTQAHAGSQVRALYAAGAAKKAAGDLTALVNELKKDGNVPVLQVLETDTPNPGYDGCGCTTCIELNCDCEHCPVCSGEMNDAPDSETQMAMYDSSIGKDDAMGSSGGVIASVPAGESSGSNFPVITTHAHVSAAVAHWMGSGKPSKLKQHIINRAREIGAEHLLPADWYPKVGKEDCCPDIEKQDPCWEGYVQRGMKPGKNGKMVPNCVPAEKADDLWEDDDTVVYETDSLSKADGYSPPAGARSAARRAIKFKEDGKANGAGTAVGWTRAGQLARGESLSLSTVKRMYSYFSRHEVDKKGKDWGNTANPSNGYIMWLAWGGDAGFSWSRRIVNAEKDKALFADFGKDYSTVEPLDIIFREGDK